MSLLRRLFGNRERTPLLTDLSFHNTLSGKLEPFSPLSPGEVKMYNCGPTVYDIQHIGNLRPYVFADTLKRALLLAGYRVKQVINLTDVGHLVSDADEGEDKLEKSAEEKGERVADIVTRVTNAYFRDLDALGIDRSKITFTKATDFIEEQMALVKTLEQKGYTYRTDDGIYFDTSKFKDYGKLGNIDLAGLREGARVEVGGKKYPTDFALWKFSPKDGKRQQEWRSPWGKGFPGWHLECAAMIFARLGRQIDIHTGGIDHIPVHHQNEIAEAESITGKQLATYWLHNAFITIEGQKISKSLGNTVYLSQLQDRGLSPLALRYLYLSAHYRSPMNFTWESIAGAQTALTRLHRFFFEEVGDKNGSPHEPFLRAFMQALGKDLDTPKCLALMWDFIKDQSISKESKRASLLIADRALGLGLNRATTGISKVAVIGESDVPSGVKELIDARERARAEKRFEEADVLRAQIAEAGYLVEDSPEGPVIHHAQ